MRASAEGSSAKVPRVVVAVVVVPLLLLVIEYFTCAASCPGSMDDEVPAAVKQEAGLTPVGRMAPCRPDALLLHALRLQSAGGDGLDVARHEGRHNDVGEGVPEKAPTTGRAPWRRAA